MAQIQMAFWKRLARLGLWLLIIGLPLLYCLLPLIVIIIAAGTPVSYSDIYIAGQPLESSEAVAAPTWMDLLRASATLAYIAWPVVLAAGVSYLILFGSSWKGRHWLHQQLWPARTLLLLSLHLAGLVVVAYIVGCLTHLLLPNALFHPATLLEQRPLAKAPDFLQAEFAREEYWWPYFKPSAGALRGYTLYSPIYMAELEFQSIKATCIKLGALLATLLWYRRAILAPSTSAQSA